MPSWRATRNVLRAHFAQDLRGPRAGIRRRGGPAASRGRSGAVGYVRRSRRYGWRCRRGPRTPGDAMFCAISAPIPPPFAVNRAAVRAAPGNGSDVRTSIRRPDQPAPICRRRVNLGGPGGRSVRAAPGAHPARRAGAARDTRPAHRGGKRRVMERSAGRNSVARSAAVGTPEPDGARPCRRAHRTCQRRSRTVLGLRIVRPASPE